MSEVLKKSIRAAGIAMAVAALTACGGGGGSSPSPAPNPEPTPVPPPVPTFTQMPDANRYFFGGVLTASGDNRGVDAHGFSDGLFVATITDPTSSYTAPSQGVIVGRFQLGNNSTTSQSFTVANAREHIFSNQMDSRYDVVDITASVLAPGYSANDAAASVEGTYARKPAAGAAVNETLKISTRAGTDITPLTAASMAGQYEGLMVGSGLPDIRTTPFQKQPLVFTNEGKFSVSPVPGCLISGDVQLFTNRKIARLVSVGDSTCAELGPSPIGVVFQADTSAGIYGIVFVGVDTSKAFYGIFRRPVFPVGG